MVRQAQHDTVFQKKPIKKAPKFRGFLFEILF